MKKFLTLFILFVLSIIAVAIFTEKPKEIVKARAKQVEAPKKIVQAPKVIVEEPKKLTEPTKKIVEVPKKAPVEHKKKVSAPKKKPESSGNIVDAFKSMVGLTKKPLPAPKKPKEPPKPAIKAPTAARGKIAIVLDDWGYTLNNWKIAEEINYPITLAILPNLPYSYRVAEEAHTKGLEVILHMPMEPFEKLNLEKDTILTSMNEREITNILDKDLTDIPYIKGINNHMGSKATSDTRTMSIIFKELKRRGLFYLDSFVTSKSVCTSLALSLNLKEFRRDVFLDNTGESSYIKKQFEILKAKADKNGFAIGIGHDRPTTLETLREVMPQAAEEGYKFVFLSDID